MHPTRQEQAWRGEETERRPLWLELEAQPGGGEVGEVSWLDPGGHCEAQSGVRDFFLSIMGRY